MAPIQPLAWEPPYAIGSALNSHDIESIHLCSIIIEIICFAFFGSFLQQKLDYVQIAIIPHTLSTTKAHTSWEIEPTFRSWGEF